MTWGKTHPEKTSQMVVMVLQSEFSEYFNIYAKIYCGYSTHVLIINFNKQW